MAVLRSILLLALITVKSSNASYLSGLWPRQTDCFPAQPAENVAERLNALFTGEASAGRSVKLCPNTEYVITSPIKFGKFNQELTTLGFPGLDLSQRAKIRVGGPTNGTDGHTVAVDGTCDECDGAALRYIQIDGNRKGAAPLRGGGNIEMGGPNQNQVIEYVHTFDPRSWSCLHIAEGPFNCLNTTIQYNDIGPCGSDNFQQWADGISLSCRNSVVRHNVITGATDGGIVIFGSPGSRIYNNTVVCKDATLLGGINMVDYDPWQGDYLDTVVENNQIMGGFATDQQDGPGDAFGTNNETAIIKIGIAMGPRAWFGPQFGMNQTRGAVVRNNQFSGAFGYAMAATTVNNFTIQGNTILPQTTFIGSVGPNCSTTDVVPAPYPFVFNASQVINSSVQPEFVDRDTDYLICIVPENDDWWPYKPTASATPPTPTSTPTTGGSTERNPSDAQGSGQSSSSGSNSSSVALGVGITIAILGSLAIAIIFRRWYLNRHPHGRRLY